MQTLFNTIQTKKEKITFEELENQTSKILPSREELVVIDTGFTNPAALSAAVPATHADTTVANHPHPPYTPTTPTQFVYNPPTFTPVHQPVVPEHPRVIYDDWKYPDWVDDKHDYHDKGHKDFDHKDWDHKDGKHDNGNHNGWYKHGHYGHHNDEWVDHRVDTRWTVPPPAHTSPVTWGVPGATAVPVTPAPVTWGVPGTSLVPATPSPVTWGTPGVGTWNPDYNVPPLANPGPGTGDPVQNWNINNSYGRTY